MNYVVTFNGATYMQSWIYHSGSLDLLSNLQPSWWGAGSLAII